MLWLATCFAVSIAFGVAPTVLRSSVSGRLLSQKTLIVANGWREMHPLMTFTAIVELLAQGFELAGVIALLVGTLMTVVRYLGALRRPPDERRRAYRGLRQGLGRAILVGLELLVAADIIRTVAIEPTFQSVGVLGLIVVVRTFLSWSLEVEINGQWPWRRAAARPPDAPLEDEV
jgi:uncharacterized membrane protein